MTVWVVSQRVGDEIQNRKLFAEEQLAVEFIREHPERFDLQIEAFEVWGKHGVEES